MSSFVRRLQRLVLPSREIHPVFNADNKLVGYRANPPRTALAEARQIKLGVANPNDKSLLARLAREAKRKAKCEGVS